MSENGEVERDDLELLRADLSKRLNGFNSNYPDVSVYELRSSRLSREEFPVPEMLLLMLRNVLGWRWSGTGEKIRWTVYGSFNGEPLSIELGKFGLTMRSSPVLDESRRRIEGQLKSAVNLVEQFIKPMIDN
ncbi:hypothetical protein V2A47_33445, partial [Pseudomonas aeruginosa]